MFSFKKLLDPVQEFIPIPAKLILEHCEEVKITILALWYHKKSMFSNVSALNLTDSVKRRKLEKNFIKEKDASASFQSVVLKLAKKLKKLWQNITV